MRRFALALAAWIALGGSACSRSEPGSNAVTAATGTGGSARGDLGPPQGEPIHALLTAPPEVPPATGRTTPALVIVELEVREIEREISEGVQYTFWTFGGTVPGSFIRVRQGDTVEFHLKNHPDSKLPHNIDLHGVTGPGGGAASSFTAPGHESQFSFKALNQGLYVYHCATAPVGMHVANGMYGLIPAGGAAIAEFRLEVPGSYVLVDHSIFRAFNKGALAILKADGPENKAIYSGKELDAVYLGDRAESLAAVAKRLRRKPLGT
jgi:nitrite reductase (NO-forming)